MQQFEIWWAKLPKPAGNRPVVLLSRNKSIGVREFIIVAQITRTIRNIPTEVFLGPTEGLPKKCVANLDVINTIPKSLLTQRIAILSAGKQREVQDALQFAFDLE